MKFETLGKEERKLLLSALDINTDNLSCHYCKEKVQYDTCGIMPPLDDKKKLAIITCSSPLCIISYLEDEKELHITSEK